MQNTVNQIKTILESTITSATFNGASYPNGQKAKESLIRSQKLINLVHEKVKQELIAHKVKPNNILPPLNQSKPELELTGFFKKKNQDICVIPSNITKISRTINWGPLGHENLLDCYGEEFSKNVLSINVRSQLSSLAKNTDTLFERTYAEAQNLHALYNDIVLGEVYLIPVYEYDNTTMLENKVTFKRSETNLEKYISFFSNISNRENTTTDFYKYEECALIIVDFSLPIPKIYKTTQELKNSGLVSNNFNVELNNISFDNFISKLLKKYEKRHNINNILD